MFNKFLNRIMRLKSTYIVNEITRRSSSMQQNAASILRERTLLFSSLGLGLLITPISPLSCASVVSNAKEGIVSVSLLTKVPTDKATIGVIPFYIKDDQVYLLLGRERIDGIKKERAGKFSDFGGTVEVDGTTLIHNASRELKEESMNQIIISEQDLLARGDVLYKTSTKGREIFYVFYPMSEQEYTNTKRLDGLWPALCAHKTEAEECEKDRFVWINAQDLVSRANTVHDIDGKQQMLSLREFFVQDCLEHPEFANMIAQLGKAKNNYRISNSM